jgi:hypothetical protein
MKDKLLGSSSSKAVVLTVHAANYVTTCMVQYGTISQPCLPLQSPSTTDNHFWVSHIRFAQSLSKMAHNGPKDVAAWIDGRFALFVLADVSNEVLHGGSLTGIEY